MQTEQMANNPEQFEKILIKLLNAPRGEDYCANGLQVDGNNPIRRILTAVTMSGEVLDDAIQQGADAIIVHHGWNWKGEDSRIIGPRAAMVRKLVTHGISLYAFHQPLDQSPDYGNNIALALALGLTPMVNERGQLETLCQGAVLRCKVKSSAGPKCAIDIKDDYERAVRKVASSMTLRDTDLRPAIHAVVAPVINGDKTVQTVAICTGGAQRLFHDLQKLPSSLIPDMYITGEISLPQVYLAKETGMAYMAGGHHNTEIFGIIALTKALQDHESIQWSRFYNDWCAV
jgi:dinuclear metal center YbgI/SA1388 family protein